MMIAMVVMKVEYGPMKVHEDNAKKGDIYTTPDRRMQIRRKRQWITVKEK